MITYTLPKATDNAEGQLDAGISASATSLAVGTGEGAEFPNATKGTATSAGTSTTLNSTGIGASGVAVGDFIENLTDGSHAYVDSVSTNSITTTPLKGGSGNTWDNSDEWAFNRFIVTLNSRDANDVITSSERILVTERTGDTFSEVTRGYSGDISQAWDTGDYVSKFVNSDELAGCQDGLAEMAIDIKTLDSEKADSTTVTALLNARNWKQACQVATVANVDLATELEAGDSIDGYTLIEGDRVLVKDQSTASENGIYIVPSSGAASRSADFDSNDDNLEGAVVSIIQGSTNSDAQFICTSDNINIGVSAIAWSQYGINSSIATEDEAEQGVDNTKIMTPLRTHEAAAARNGAFMTFGEAIDGSSTPKALSLGVDGMLYAFKSDSSAFGDVAASIYNWNATCNLNIAQSSSNLKRAVIFTVPDMDGGTADITNMYIPLAGSTGTSRTAEVTIQEVTGSDPDGTITATANTIAGLQSTGDDNMKQVTFGSTVTLNQGQTYAVVLEMSQATNGSDYILSASGSGTGRVENGGVWGVGANFQIYLELEFNLAGKVFEFDPTHSLRGNFIGFTQDNVAAAGSGLVQFRERIDGFSGLTAGSKVWPDQSTPGAITQTAPSGSGRILIQSFGRAVSATEIYIEPSRCRVYSANNSYNTDAGSGGSTTCIFLHPTGGTPEVVDHSHAFRDTSGSGNNDRVRTGRVLRASSGPGVNVNDLDSAPALTVLSAVTDFGSFGSSLISSFEPNGVLTTITTSDNLEEYQNHYYITEC